MPGLPERIKEILNASARSEVRALCELSVLFDSLCRQGAISMAEVEEVSELCRDVIRVTRRYNRNVRRIAEAEEHLLRSDDAPDGSAI